ncbi:MAG: iron ABC transporter permease [Ardenticatenaceae bacterium]|nr:iron ABC transporter permease [Ardenticatenaceae bacterium]
MISESTTKQIVWPDVGTRSFLLTGLACALVLTFGVSLMFGSVRIPLVDLLKILVGEEPARATWTTIVFQFRLPKATTAVLAGSALALSGLQMQTLFRNPLAGPFVLGISSGASLGVAIVVLSVGTAVTGLLSALGLLGNFGVIIAASLGSGLVLFSVMAVAHRVNNMTLLILGLLFGYATSALVSILLYFSISERIQAYIAWTFGSFGGVTWDQLQVLIPAVLIGLAIAWRSTKALNALLLGEQYARSLGLTVRSARIWILLSASLLAGAITAFCGPIAFVGVAVPHLCRSLFNTSDHRVLVPAVVFTGGIAALVTDLIAQMPGSQTVLPLNAVTALFGAPIVAWVILRRRNLRASFGR